jgi:hypothetical protein
MRVANFCWHALLFPRNSLSYREGPKADLADAGQIILYKNGIQMGEEGEFFGLSDPKVQGMMDEVRGFGCRVCVRCSARAFVCTIVYGCCFVTLLSFPTTVARRQCAS